MKTKSLILFALFFLPLFCFPQLKVKTDGRVKIGSGSGTPDAGDLQIVQNNITTEARIFATSPNIARLWTMNSIYSFGFGVDANGTGQIFKNITSPTSILSFNSSGNFGFNTAPISTFKLNIYNNVNGYGAIYCDVYHTTDWGQAISTKLYRPYTVSYVVNYNGADRYFVRGDGLACSEAGFYTWSDLSFKENIKTITSPLQKVLNLRGVTYNLKKENIFDSLTYVPTESNPVQIGLIAQEVEKIIPEVVMEMPNGKKAIAYQNLVGLLIEAIKEQQNTINLQNERINLIENDLSKCCSEINQTQNLNQSNLINNDSENPILFQNIPNPFDIKTTIKYYLPENSINPAILIFDMQGSHIKTYSIQKTGTGTIEINGRDLLPGMYMYSLIANNKEVDTKKMILTK